MSADARVLELLEEVLATGRTPEDVCADMPELLADVRARLGRVHRLDRELAALLPANAPAPQESVELPDIAGYDVETVLGRGGMGVVYRARHRELKRLVALKMMLGGAHAGPDARARFRREAEAIAALCHPNFVQVHDVGESGGLPYFTMEFVEGGTLATRIGGRPLRPRDASALVATLATAMHAAHQAGVVHRDLKPANVLLTDDGTLKITDFGLARRVEGEAALTSIGARVGTPSYMAPEQASGLLEAIGPAADVYALGAILYEALTGRPPFVGASAAETEWQVVHDDPVPPTRLNRAVPRDLETIALKCLQKEPARRYESAGELAADLRRFERGEPIAARRAGRFERAAKWARRRPAQSFAIAATLLLVSAIAGGATWVGLERSAAVRAADQDLQEAVRRERASEWSEARGALSRAALRLGDRSAPALRGRIEQVGRELDLVDRLGAIRLARAVNPRIDFDRAHCDRDYRDAFAGAGLIAGLPLEPEAIARTGWRIAAMDARAALVSALDDWSVCVNHQGELQCLLQIARFADPDPRWRDRLRNPILWSDPAVLDQLERDVDVARESVTVLTLFAWVLENFGRDDLDLRKRTQQAHADDFWATFHLAESLDARSDPDAIGFYRAALALRPSAVAVHVNLGVVLARHGRAEEAIDCWERALELDPEVATLHFNLGISHFNARQLAPALEHFQEAVRLDPDLGRAQSMLGRTLLKLGRPSEAEPQFVRAVERLRATPKPRGDPYLENATNGIEEARRAMAIERRLPELLDGRDLPADAAEALEIATLLCNRSWYVSAAEFYEMALGQQPSLADDVGSGIRWSAATAALLAGTDRDVGEFALDDDERARWRNRALEWLRADLAVVTARLAGGAAAGGTETNLLDRWREDPDFAAVREVDALDGLPLAQREQWHEFWKDVDAQRARAPQAR